MATSVVQLQRQQALCLLYLQLIIITIVNVPNPLACAPDDSIIFRHAEFIVRPLEIAQCFWQHFTGTASQNVANDEDGTTGRNMVICIKKRKTLDRIALMRWPLVSHEFCMPEAIWITVDVLQRPPQKDLDLGHLVHFGGGEPAAK